MPLYVKVDMTTPLFQALEVAARAKRQTLSDFLVDAWNDARLEETVASIPSQELTEILKPFICAPIMTMWVACVSSELIDRMRPTSGSNPVDAETLDTWLEAQPCKILTAGVARAWHIPKAFKMLPTPERRLTALFDSVLELDRRRS